MTTGASFDSPHTAGGSLNRRSFIKTSAPSLAVTAGLSIVPTAAHADGATDIPSANGADVAITVAGMSRRQKTKQRLMPNLLEWSGANFMVMNDDVARIIDDYDFCDIILFANNVKETGQALNLRRDMHVAALKNTNRTSYGDIPLLLTIDQEGGIVYHLSSGTAPSGNMAVSGTRSNDDTTPYGKVIGRELPVLKTNVNFAPAFDPNRNLNTPVIGLRSASSKSEPVFELCVLMMQGMQERNMAPTAKHFPSHGDTGTDSHTGLLRIEKAKEQLETVAFAPFKAAIAASVDIVMTAHIQYPNVETEKVTSIKDSVSQMKLPATLSHVLMTDILRNEMGFKNVSVTDALNMDTIAENFEYIDAVKRTFKASVDIAPMPLVLSTEDGVAKLDDLIDALEQDPDIADDDLSASVMRILTLMKSLGILDYTPGDADQELFNAIAAVGSDENRSIEREVVADAVIVIKNDGDILPFCPKSGDHVLLVAAWDNETPGMELAMRRLIAEKTIPQTSPMGPLTTRRPTGTIRPPRWTRFFPWWQRPRKS